MDAGLAYTLINSNVPAPLQTWMFEQSIRSWDYAAGLPYPKHAFARSEWPRNKGPLPTPIPILSNILSEGADFLFRGGPPAFSVPSQQNAGLEKADEFLQKVIRSNRLGELWHSLAEACANQGALAAKFSVDLDDSERPVRISFLDVPQECRVWFDPHDLTQPIFARIQYPYRDMATGDWYYYREEWSDAFQVTYRPRFAAKRDLNIQSILDLPHYATSMGDDAEWEIEDLLDNPLGVLPVTVIRNRRMKGNPLGEGDLWGWFKLVDRVAVTLHDSDRWNQKNSDPIKAILNAELDGDDPLLPGEDLELHNDNPAGPPADVKLLEPTGAARAFVFQYAEKLERYAWERAGYSYIDLAQIGNKGAWTQLAFEVTYSKTISTTNKKRELWGNSGLCVFFRNLLLGLRNLGGVGELSAVDEETEVSAEWQPFFAPTDEDKAALTDRTVTQVQSGFLTEERGAERVARMEGIPQHEIKDLLSELESLSDQRHEVDEEQAAQEEANADGSPEPPAGKAEAARPSVK